MLALSAVSSKALALIPALTISHQDYDGNPPGPSASSLSLYLFRPLS